MNSGQKVSPPPRRNGRRYMAQPPPAPAPSSGARSQSKKLDLTPLGTPFDAGNNWGNKEAVVVQSIDGGGRAEKNSALHEGMKVEARYKGKTRYYAGVIKRENRDGTFDVDYDDGEKELVVNAELIRALEPTRKGRGGGNVGLREGIKVEANYRGKGQFFKGVISRENLNGTFVVDYDDGEKEMFVESYMIRSLESRGYGSPVRGGGSGGTSFREGDKVEALYKGKGTEWFKGAISRDNRDGTFEIQYDDGDCEKSALAANIRLIDGDHSGGGVGENNSALREGIKAEASENEKGALAANIRLIDGGHSGGDVVESNSALREGVKVEASENEKGVLAANIRLIDVYHSSGSLDEEVGLITGDEAEEREKTLEARQADAGDNDNSDEKSPLLCAQNSGYSFSEIMRSKEFEFLSPKIVKFDESEIVAFSLLAKYAEGNPRRMKRVVNSYTLSRALAKTEAKDWPIFREKLLRWTLLCEQWPTRISWVLQIMSDEQNLFLDLWHAHGDNLSLGDFYKHHVESRVFDTKMDQCQERLRDQYAKLFLLDGDPETFEALLDQKPFIMMSDIGDLSTRRKTSLLSFTTNLNPAIQFSLARICAHREDGKEVDENMSRHYARRGIFDFHELESSAAPHRIVIEAGNSLEPLLLSPKSEKSGFVIDKKNDEPVHEDEKMQTSGALEDSMAGADLVGYSSYASVLSQLVLNLKTCPLVIALYAGWGTGKSFIMNKVVAHLKYASLLQELSSIDKISKYAKKMARAKKNVEAKNIAEAKWYSGITKAKMNALAKNKAGEAKEEAKEEAKWLSTLLDQEKVDNEWSEYAYKIGEAKRLRDMLDADQENSLNNEWNDLRLHEHKGDFVVAEELLAFFGYFSSLLLVIKTLCTSAASDASPAEISLSFSATSNAYAKRAKAALKQKVLEPIILRSIEVSDESSCLGIRSFNVIAETTTVKVSFEVTGSLAQAGFSTGSELARTGLQRRIDDGSLSNAVRLSCGASCAGLRATTVSFKNGINENMEKTPADSSADAQEFYEYEFVWFNAWLYNGTSNLWAALILKLYTSVESHYGHEFAFAKRRAMLWDLIFKVLLALILVAIGSFTLTLSSTTAIITRNSVFALSVPLCLAVARSLYQNVITPLSISMELVEDAGNSEFTKRLGFMDLVRERLFKIGDLLEHPSKVDTAWDTFLSEKWIPSIFHPLRSRVLAYFNHKAYGKHRKCRLVIFVDDLDRCDPEKCVEVLASINLMCEGLPFVIFLAIDPRVVVCSIELVNERFYDNVGISGYAYLDKIVQVPFSIPALCQSEKVGMLRGYLTGKGASTRDYSIITKFDNMIPTLPTRYPDGLTFIGGNILFTSQFGGTKLLDPDTGETLKDYSELIKSHWGTSFNGDINGGQISSIPTGGFLLASKSKVVLFNANFEHVRDFTGLTGCKGVASSKTTVYALDTGRNRIVFFDLKSGNQTIDPVGKTGTGNGEFDNPQTIVCIEDRLLAVADRGNDRVQILGVDGTHKYNIGVGKVSRPNSVAIDADGNLLVYDTKNRRVAVFTLEGKFICSVMPGFFHEGVVSGGDFNYCYIACCHATGRVAVSDNDNHRIALLKPHLY